MLTFLERMAAGFWSFSYRVVGLILPFFTRTRDVRQLGRTLWWILHVVLVLVVLGVCYWLNTYFNLGELLQAPTVFGIRLKDFWLPILFLLLYTLAWLGWWIWQLLGPEEDQVEYPDIDEAWEEALQALNTAGIGLTDAPLFLVLGRPGAGEASLFSAADMPFPVKNAPGRADSPLRVYANRDAIFVTCVGASQLGKQSVLLTEASGDSTDAGAYGYGAGGAEEGADAGKTLSPQENLRYKEIANIIRRAAQEGRPVTTAEQARIKQLEKEDRAGGAKPGGKAQAMYLKHNPEEAERLTDRLRYLCKLIVRDRRPYTPLNGLLVVVPFPATESDESATQSGAVCQQDLLTARQVLKIQCSLFYLVSDMETTPGFREFVARFQKDERKRRLGQRFPMQPDVADNVSVPDLVEDSVRWICTSLIPTWVYKRFELETSRGSYTENTKGNNQLYWLLGEMVDRRKRFGTLVRRSLAVEGRIPWWFGGCYIAATGEDAGQAQAFVSGVFRRLLDHVNDIAWTDEALTEDASFHSWAWRGYMLIVFMAVVSIGLLFYALR